MAAVLNPIVEETSKNPAVREWHTKNLAQLLEEAYRNLKISPEEFDVVAAELALT